MLYIESNLPATDATVECDGYVPLIVRLKGDFQFPAKYWRIGDFNQSLVEIRIDPSNGALYRVTITLLKELLGEPLPQVHFDSIPEGLPCTSVSIWEDGSNRIDVEQPVLASLFDNRLVLRFGEIVDALPNSTRCGRLAFLIDEKHVLRGIEVCDLTGEEIDNLRFTIER